MKIFIDDKGRYKSNNGYGNLSRNIGLALNIAGCDVFYDEAKSKPWDTSLTENKILSFENSINYGRYQDCDVALTISPPTERKILDIPNLIYTQNALDGLKEDWGIFCSKYDGVIVPGDFDKRDFMLWNSKTYVCPQIIDNKLFQNRPKWRDEGSDKFTFIFIGSLSYRKGVDLLLESFGRFSKIDNNSSKLVMICPGAKNINFLLNKIRNVNPYSDVDLYIEDLSQEWICRYINRADVFVSLSRGEGWCMPVFESILCEKPVLVPKSTAMSEATPNNSVIKIDTSVVPIRTTEDEFAKGFRNQYGEKHIASYDVDIVSAIKAFKEIKDNYGLYKANTLESREFVLSNYSHNNVGIRLKEVLLEVIGS